MRNVSASFVFSMKNEGNIQEIAQLYMKFFSHLKFNDKTKEIKETLEKKKLLVILFFS